MPKKRDALDCPRAYMEDEFEYTWWQAQQRYQQWAEEQYDALWEGREPRKCPVPR